MSSGNPSRLGMRLACALAVALPLLCGSQAHALTFQGLGHLPGGAISYAMAVSADGSVVVGSSHSAAGEEAFRWENGVMTGLGDLPGGFHRGRALDVSADGSVVTGWSSSAAGWEAFRWENGTMIGLGDVPGADVNSQGRAISADGGVIVGEAEPETNLEIAMRYESGVMSELGHLGTGLGRSSASGVSDDGSVVVGGALDAEDPSPHWQAFRWEDGTMVALGDAPPGLGYDQAADVSGDGSVIVGTQIVSGVTEAFRYVGGVRTGLGDLPGGMEYSEARAVSGDGTRVVGLGYTAAGPDVFVWTEGEGMVSLVEAMTLAGVDLTGWEDWSVHGLSADGSTIVGEARHDGNVEAWVAVLSEPSTGPAALPAVPPWGGPLLAASLLALGVSAVAGRAE